MSNNHADTEYLDLPVQTRAAEVVPSSLDTERRTVEVVASTGATVRRLGWMGDYDEQLVISEQAVDLQRLARVGPVLDNHNSYGSVSGVLGVVERAWIENGQLIASLKFDTSPEADEVFRKIGAGILRAVSIGYDAEYERIRAKDRDDDGERDLYRTKWLEPYEVSVVMMPADAGAVVRSAPTGATRRYAVRSREEMMPMSTQQQPQQPNQATAEETRAAEAKIAKEAQKRAFERAASTRTLLRSLALDESKAEELVQAHDEDDALRSAVLDMKIRAQESQAAQGIGGPGAVVRVDVGRSVEEKFGELLGHGLELRTLGTVDPKKIAAHNERAAKDARVEKIAPPKHDDHDVARTARKSMLQLAEEFLQARNIDTRRMSPNEIAMRALSYRSGSGGLATTSDFSSLLGNTANKMLWAGYAEVTSPWRELIGRRMDRPDFKQFSIFRRSGAPDLEVVNEHGEIKRSSYHVPTALVGQLATAGIEVGFTRQMLINDDLDAFAQASLGLGDAAMRFEDDTVIIDLLYGNPQLNDGTDFFHSDRGNLSTDTGAPDLAAVTEVARLFAKMTETIRTAGANAPTTTRKASQDVGGFIGAFTEAVAINQILRPEGYMPTAASSALPDYLRGLNAYREARLAIEASSPDVWFGFSANRRAIAYGYLSGENGPRLRQMEAIGTDGIVFQCLHDWYGAVADPYAMVRVPKS